MFLRSSRAHNKARNKAHRRLREKLFRTMRLEPLEPRIVLAAPIGGDDIGYSTLVNTRLDVPAPGFLANDYDPDGDPFWLYDYRLNQPGVDPAHVNVTLSGSGAIGFQPTEVLMQYYPGATPTNWTFVGTFEYRLSDGVEISDWINLHIGTYAGGVEQALELTYVCPTCSCPCQGQQVATSMNSGTEKKTISSSPGSGATSTSPHGGGAANGGAGGSGDRLVSDGLAYSSDAAAAEKTQVVFDRAPGFTLPPNAEIQAYAYIGGTDYRGELAFDPSTYSPTETYRFNFEFDMSGMATDVYHVKIGFRVRDSVTGEQLTTRYVGILPHFNLSDSAQFQNPLGRGWNLEAQELLIKVDGEYDDSEDRNDLMWVKGDGTMHLFLLDDPTGMYFPAESDLNQNTLTKINDTTFEMVDKYGTRRRFENNALVWLDDRHGNRTTFAWSGNSLASITHPGGAVTTYGYGANGKVTSITDFAARVTNLGYAGSDLTTITRPDPDGAGPLAAPVLTYAYDTMGRITTFTDPDGKTHTYTYWDTGTRKRHTLPNGAFNELTPRHHLAFLPGPYTAGGSLRPFFKTSDVIGAYTDELGRQTTFVTDRWGNFTKTIGPAGTIITTRNAYGLPTQVELPDPDGTGPEAAPVHTFTYAGTSVASESLYSGTITRSWTYGVNSQVASYTNELGGVTTFTLDAVGNATDSTIVINSLPATSTYTYTTTGIKGLLASITDPLNSVTNITYNAHALPTTIVEAAGTSVAGTTTIAYDAYDRVASVSDPLSRVTSYTYDLLDHLLTAALPDPDLGGPLTAPVYAYQYDILGRKKKETDPLGRVTEYEYDEVHNLLNVEQTDYNGITVVAVNQWVYDFGHRLTSVTDPLGRTTSFQYNALDNLIQTTQPDPDGAGPLAQPIWMWAYDVLSRQTYAIDPLGARGDFAYQNVWRTVIATPPDPLSGSPGAYDTTTVMNAAGQATSYTDELGRETTYSYNAFGWFTGVILPDPDGPSNPLASPFSSITYNSVGNIASTTDHAHRTADYFYDARHRLIEVREVDPDGGGPLGRPSTFYAYDAASQLTSMTDPRGKVTSYEYDNLGRLKRTLEADPDDGGPLARPETLYAYDAASRLTSVIDALGHLTAYQYNALDDLILVVLPDPDGVGPLASPEWEYTYDAASQLLSATDPLNHTTTYGYDNLGRMILATDPLSGQTAYNYDAIGNLKILTDPVGNDTVWNYDKRYRVTSEMNELGKTRYFEYDPVGNLTERTDRNGRVIEFTYDNLDRVTQEAWLGTGARTLTFVYDAYARLNSAGDVSATYRYAYDVVGQVALETQEIAGLAALAYEHTYDINGNLLTTSATLGVTVSPGDPPSISGGAYDFKNEFTYDNLNRLTKLTQQSQSGGNVVAEKRVDFAYNAVHQFTDIDRYQNLTGTQLVAHTDFGYDNLGRLTSIDHLKGATTFSAYDLTYDAASRITAIDEVFSNSAWNETHQYTYDNTDQLTSANHSVQDDEAYDFDANGNRDGSQTHLGSTNTSTVIANNRISSDGIHNYTYDDEGNLLTKTKISNGDKEEYTWDHRNRLTKVTFKNSGGTVLNTVEYDYDYLNRMLSRKETPYSGGIPGTATTDYFVHDGMQIVLQFQKVGAGSVNLTNRYLWGPQQDQLLVDEKVSSTSSPGTNHWALTNHLGNVIDVATFDPGIDATSIVKHRRIDAFGNVTFDSATSVIMVFAYTGKYRDAATGWSQHVDRWLVTIIGIWASVDPEGFGAGDSNLSRYSFNTPIIATDPSGRVVVWVEGISTDQNNSFAKHFAAGLAAYWMDNKQAQQAFIYLGFEAAWTKDGTTNKTDYDRQVAKQLKVLVDQLNKNNKCGEPIYIVGFSNGASIISAALELGMKADGVVFLGAALDRDEDLQAEMKNASWIVNYRSNDDWTAGNFADGMGSRAMREVEKTPDGKPVKNKSLPGVQDVLVAKMTHTERGANVSGSTVMKKNTKTQKVPWTSYYAAYAFVAKLLTPGATCLSNGTVLKQPDGSTITTQPGAQVFETGEKHAEE